jgi:hypothetical protein
MIEFAVDPPAPCAAEISAGGGQSGRDPSLSAMRTIKLGSGRSSEELLFFFSALN